MEVKTSQFEFSHGRKPRGNGSWVFRLVGTDGSGAWLTEERRASGIMREALRLAIRQWRAEVPRLKSVISAEVLP